MSYYREVYLKSPEWKEIRSRKESKTAKRCGICLSTEQIDLHHLFYRKELAQTETSDLRWLCRRCHELAHKLINNGAIKFKAGWSHHAMFACTKSKVKSSLGLCRIRIDPDHPKTKEIEAARSSKGGWTREALEKLGVAWPPPKGWRKQMIRNEMQKDLIV